MKIIDFDGDKRNVIRFYLRQDELEKWEGDDWDDRPFEHNAGKVYDKYISEVYDAFIPWDYAVLFPDDGVANSIYSKEDLVKRTAPCTIIIPPSEFIHGLDPYRFSDYVGNKNIIKIYIGDDISTVKELINNLY